MHMKKSIGFCILVILLVAASGCAQQTTPAPAATTPATPVPTVATTEATPVPPTVATTPPTTLATQKTTPDAANVTTTAPTAIPSPRVSLKPQTQTTTIRITGTAFSPADLTVLPGTGMTWRNDDKVIHAVKTTGKHAGMFNSGDILPGSSWSYTFTQRENTYEIIDPNFPQMKCIITVRDGDTSN